MKDLINEEIDKREDRAKHSDFELDSYLEHYGIKGMRWGVSRSDKKLAKARASSRTIYEKGPKELSANELKRRVNRMETEKRYVALNPPTADTNKGKNFVVKKVEQFSDAYTGILIGVGAGAASAATIALVKAKMGK